MKKLSFGLLLLLAAFISNAQSPVLENNPPSIKWYQVNTANFRVIFPKGFDTQAQRVANTLEHLHAAEAKTIGSSPRKISLILQNQSSLSNAFVSVLPRRSEFYTTPPQDYNFIGANDWLDMLASHEYRHIVQYQHARRGFNNVLYYLFGATTFAGMSQAAAPDWFWEGDAVATETAFTKTGRGKIPKFSLAFRTNLLEGREFNYHKQYLRSYKHFMPDEYVIGYHLTSYLRKRTNDPNIWGKISGRAWNVPFIPFTFSNAIKKESGLYVTQLYREMAKDFKKDWNEKLSQLELTPYEKVNARKNKAYTDYLYPQPQPDGSIIALKRGIGDIDQFVRITNDGEKRIFTPGLTNDAGMLSAVNGKIVWNEYGFDPRWLVRDYSLVKGINITDNKKKSVLGSRKERYGSAALSPDGQKVVAIRNDVSYQTQIVILDFTSGNVLKQFDNPENYFFSMPRWADDGKRIAVLKTTRGGKSISILDTETGQLTDVTSESDENVGHPVLYGDYLLYNSPISEIDNIYAIRLSSGEKFKITTSRHGAFNPAVSPDGKFLYYNDQSKDGLDIVKIPFDSSALHPYTPQVEGVDSYSHLIEQEGGTQVFETVPQTQLPVAKYSKFRGLVNPYTWGLNVETDLTRATIGLSSKDILSTTAVDLGYEYDINERTGSFFARASYQAWFPIIDFTARYGKRSVNEGLFPVAKGNSYEFKELNFEWTERTFEGGLRIPLTITRSRFISNVTLSDNLGITFVQNFKNNLDGNGRILPIPTTDTVFRFTDYIDHGSLIYNHFSLSAYRVLKRSYRDINSKFGQVINLEYYNTMNAGELGDFQGNQFSIYGILYLPGLFKHHSLWGYWAYQHTQIEDSDNNYTFRNNIPLPRGLGVVLSENLYTMSVNYTLPLWYPDIAIGPLLNIQRVRANAFFDYGAGSTQVLLRNYEYSSVGAEVKLDINILRFKPQFDIGVRFSKGLSPSTSEIELLIGTFNL